jgi:UDP-2,4-diacetamido-2,4,6-trideoxy-beta-L-altropyranose hydrolase
MRDLILAQYYSKKGGNIIFATQNLDGNINHKILEFKFIVENLNSNSKKKLIKLIKKLKIDMLVVDHYDINYKKEKYIKDKTKVKILSLDDTYQKHHCDILLNHNIYANIKRYKNLVPSKCKIKCGSEYTLLRDEFRIEKNKKTILLAMGGADTANLNLAILGILKTCDNIMVNVITTIANKNLEELKQYSKNISWINLHINSNKVAKLMKKSDLAIVTPSVTLNEIYFMNIPFIAIQTAKNQKYMYKYLKDQKCFRLKRFNQKKLNNYIRKKLKEILD